MTDPIEYLRIQAGGSNKLFNMMIDTFKEEYKQDLLDIKQGIQNRNVKEMSGFAHKYKNRVIYFYPLDHDFIRTLQQMQDSEKITKSTVRQFKQVLKYTVELIKELKLEA